MTATSFAGSGAALTGVGVSGISSSADATAMTITSDENIGIGTTTPPERLSIHEPSTGTGTYLPVAITGANHATGYGVGISFKTENTSPTQKAKAAIIAEGTGEGYNKTSLHIAMSNTNDTTTEVALANSVLEFTMDGRGVSEFTTRAWCSFDGTGTVSINDSHNVSSLTDLGTGSYRVSFSSALSNAYPAVAVSGIHGNNFSVNPCLHDEPTDGRVDIRCIQEQNSSFNIVDTELVTVMVTGD